MKFIPMRPYVVEFYLLFFVGDFSTSKWRSSTDARVVDQSPSLADAFTFIPLQGFAKEREKQLQSRYFNKKNSENGSYSTASLQHQSILYVSMAEASQDDYSVSQFVLSKKAAVKLKTDETGLNDIMDTLLYPKSEKNARLDAGSMAQGLHRGQGCITSGKALTLHDDSMGLTYTEFPPESFHSLVSRAKHYVTEEKGTSRNTKPETASVAPTQTHYSSAFVSNPYASIEEIAAGSQSTVVDPKSVSVISSLHRHKKLFDLGSGTGRLVMYAALVEAETHLSSKDDDNSGSTIWDIHGIEIAEELHNVGVQLMNRATDDGLIEPLLAESAKSLSGEYPTISLHKGSVQVCASRGILDDADLLFCYSTVLPTVGFSVECEAMLITPEWSKVLAHACPEGCIAIMTDRILDPAYGWELVERMEVENPELFGSIGYIQRLRKKNAHGILPTPPVLPSQISF